MIWNEDLYEQNDPEVRKHATAIAQLLVDEAEAFVAAHPDDELEVQDIVEERLQMALDALDQRILQQLTVRGHARD